MASTAAPLAFACEADEKAYAALMKKLNDKADRLTIPGFSFARPGAHTYPAGVFPAMLQLIRKAPSVKKFKAAKELVAQAGLARVERTGANGGDKVVHREDVLQAIGVLLAAADDGPSSAAATTEKQSIRVVPQQDATTSAGAAKTEEVAATVKFDDMETYDLTITVKGLASTVEREMDNKFRLFGEKIRQRERERDGAVAAQAIMASMLHEVGGERDALDRLVDELQKERNEWRDIAIERNGTTAALTKQRDEREGVVKDLRKLLGDRDKQLDDTAKQLDDMKKQRGCWRDIANTVQRQRDDWHGRAGDMKDERDGKQKERDEWKEFAQDMKAQRDCLRSAVEKLSAKYSTLEAHTKEREQEAERLRKDLQDRNTRCAGLAKEVEALKEERDSSQGQGRRRKFPKLTDSCPFTEK